MNITIATPHLVYPTVPHAGGQDLFQLIGALREHHTVRVVAFVDDASAPHAPALRPFVDELQLVWPAIGWRAKSRSAIQGVLNGNWNRLGQRAEHELRNTIARWPTDVLHCAWTEMGRYLDAAPDGALRVLDEVDVRFVVDAAAAHPQAAQRKTQELAWCDSADLVLTRSQRDLAALLSELPALNGLVIPPVGNRDALELINDYQPEGSNVLFVGAMNRRRNQQAAQWLLDDIWPLVCAAHPAAELTIAGAEPPDQLRKSAEKQNVRVTGFVDDLRPYYENAAVVVAPMRSEAGLLNKVVDAMAARRPVVLTNRANAAIAAPADCARVADSASDFAAAIVHLLADPQSASNLGQAARQFVRDTYNWRTAVSQYLALLTTHQSPIPNPHPQ